MNISRVRVRSQNEERLAVQLCAALAKIAALEAQNAGQREAIAVLRQYRDLANDLAAARDAEREACARAVEDLGFSAGAKRIRERTASETFARRPLTP